MKPVFKCDYCSQMGTEEEIKEHEQNCINNYSKRSCYTCKNKAIRPASEKGWYLQCKLGKEIPSGSVIEFCEHYNKKEENQSSLDELIDMFF